MSEMPSSAADGTSDRKIRLSYGVDWGYSSLVFNQHHFNYNSPEGMRVNQIDNDLDYCMNGYCRLYCGADILNRWNIVLNAGANGLERGRVVNVFALRVTYLPNGCRNDGFKLFLQDGIGLSETFNEKFDNVAEIGTGYRFQLSGSISLDANLGIQVGFDHPFIIYDKYSGIQVPNNLIRRSDSVTSSINFGLSLNF